MNTPRGIMLKIQQWLVENQGNFTKLEEEFGITTNFCSDTDPRVILNYSQINSPKNDPIVKECRGLVLDKNTYEIVAKGFDRFFNLDENDGHPNFVWDNCRCFEKVDGSYISVTFWNNQLCIHTRNSFAEGEVNNSGKTWRELVLSCLTEEAIKEIIHYPGNTYIFELCSPYNKVVKFYPKPQLYLLGIFNKIKGYSFIIHAPSNKMNIPTPKEYWVRDRNELAQLITKIQEENPTDEGVVLTDINGLRVKIKTQSYFRLHKLFGNGNIYSVKTLLPIILVGETGETLAYYPETKPLIDNINQWLENIKKNLSETYNKYNGIEEQKLFAIAVKDHPLSSIMFLARKLKQCPLEIFTTKENLLLLLYEKGTSK